MISFTNFKSLRARILSVFIVLIAFIAAFSIYNFIVNNSMEKNAEELINHQLEMLTANQTLATSVTVRAAATTNFITTGDEKYIDIFNTYSESALEQVDYLNELDPEGKEEREAYMEQGTQWRTDIEEKVFAPQIAGDTNTAINNLRELNDQATVVRTGYDELVAKNVANIDTLGEDIIQSSAKTKNIGLIISIMILIIGILFATYISNTIARPVSRVTERMEAMAEGDLTHQLFNSNRRDEIGTLSHAIDNLTAKMQSILSSIHNVSENVAAHSEELAQSANEVKHGSDQIAVTMHEIAEGTDTQARRTTNLAEIIVEYKQGVQSASEEGQSLFALSGDVQQLTLLGQGKMVETSTQMLSIDQIVHDAVEKVESLNHQSLQITNLVSVISDIANQTNLLALNAAIEAARAGEHGKGFAVVADEVRKLAEQVQYSVSDISTIVETIQTETTTVTSTLHSGYEEVRKGTAQMNETAVTFNEISIAVEKMINNIESIASNLNEIEHKTSVINETVEEIAAVTEESAAGIQQTSATVQETTSTMEEMASSTDQLAQMAMKLNDEVQQFKLS